MRTYQGNEESLTLAEIMTDDDLKLDHIPDVRECRELRRRFKVEGFWPNVWHINDHGNVDLLVIGYNGAIIEQSWV